MESKNGGGLGTRLSVHCCSYLKISNIAGHVATTMHGKFSAPISKGYVVTYMSPVDMFAAAIKVF